MSAFPLPDLAELPDVPGLEERRLARAGQRQQQQLKNDFLESSSRSSSSEADEFAEALAPLESKQGRRLAGTYRDLCAAAYEENPDGFRLVANDALERGFRPLGLLVKMVREGDHRASAPPRWDADRERQRQREEHFRRIAQEHPEWYR